MGRVYIGQTKNHTRLRQHRQGHNSSEISNTLEITNITLIINNEEVEMLDK